MKFHQPARRPVQTFTAAFDDDKPSCEDCVEEHNEGISR